MDKNFVKIPRRGTMYIPKDELRALNVYKIMSIILMCYTLIQIILYFNLGVEVPDNIDLIISGITTFIIPLLLFLYNKYVERRHNMAHIHPNPDFLNTKNSENDNSNNSEYDNSANSYVESKNSEYDNSEPSNLENSYVKPKDINQVFKFNNKVNNKVKPTQKKIKPVKNNSSYSRNSESDFSSIFN
jgi:hypothetical protein